jgi:hypothetical protein
MTDPAPDSPDPSSAHPEPAEGPATDLADFTPVPRRMNRGDVWTAEVQRDFIEAIADLGSVEAACRAVGRSPASAYRLRRHPLGEGFAAAWQAAIDLGIQRIEDCAVDRAVNGVEVPMFLHGGEQVTRRVYNDRLVMFMLRNRAPERYCAGGARSLSAIDARSLARLKAQRRAEWERERAALDQEEEQDTLESLDRFLEDMRERREANAKVAAEPIAEGEDDDYDDEADAPAAALVPPEPDEPAEAPDPEPPGPRLRSLKDDWR